MKKIFYLFIVFLTVNAYSNEVVYSKNVKNLYESPKSTKVAGRLLPTSKITLVEKVGDRVKIKASGYSKEGVDNAIYFVPGKRILVAGLSKKNSFEINNISQKEDEEGTTWNEVTLTAYIKEGDVSKEIEPLYEEAKKLYSTNCAICHAAHPTTEFTANQWPSMIGAMVGRTALTKNQSYLISQYLQKHARDMKGK